MTSWSLSKFYFSDEWNPFAVNFHVIFLQEEVPNGIVTQTFVKKLTIVFINSFYHDDDDNNRLLVSLRPPPEESRNPTVTDLELSLYVKSASTRRVLIFW